MMSLNGRYPFYELERQSREQWLGGGVARESGGLEAPSRGCGRPCARDLRGFGTSGQGSGAADGVVQGCTEGSPGHRRVNAGAGAPAAREGCTVRGGGAVAARGGGTSQSSGAAEGGGRGNEHKGPGRRARRRRRTRIRTYTNPYGTEANAAGRNGRACVARAVSVERGGMDERGCARRLGEWMWV